MTRLVEAWRRLERERRFAAVASLALFISMFLPWYQQNGVVKAGNLESRNLDAFQVFSFVEAAVLLVALALLYMLYARAEGRDFRVPGGDGTIVLLAGAWVSVLLIFRLFDKPGISSHGVAGNVGVQWGIFFALAAAGLIAYSGSRMRGLHAGPRLRPDGHLRGDAHTARPRAWEGGRDAAEPRDAPEPRGRSPRERDRRDAPAASAGEDTARQPERTRPRAAPHPELAWSDPPARRDPHEAATEPGSAKTAPHETQPTRVVPPGRPAAATPAGARGRPRYPPAPDEPTLTGAGEQLSFEEAPPKQDER